jgi:hypothetical protein
MAGCDIRKFRSVQTEVHKYISLAAMRMNDIGRG